MSYERVGDAAFAVNLDGTSFPLVGGYYGGPNAFNVWSVPDWHRFPGFRLPIWVAGAPGNGPAEAGAAVEALEALGVPKGSRTVIDMEARIDRQLVENFGAALQAAGYLLEVYGSASTVFNHPPLNGYWVADFTADMTQIDQLLAHPHVRAVQYATNHLYDTSLRKPWTNEEMWHG
jgi:hypothetical protein